MTRSLWAVALLALTACTAEQPAPPKFADTDPCTLLASGDAGDLTATPARAERACGYTFGSLTVRLTLRTEKFADVSQPLLADGGYGAVIEDHPMTRRCTDAAGTVTCEAVVEVRDGQLLAFTVVQKHNDPNVVGQTTQGLALKALGRVPADAV